MTILYLVIGVGLTGWLWLLREPAEEHGHDGLHYWLTNLSIGYGVGTFMVALGSQSVVGISDFLMSGPIAAFFIGLARTGWRKLLEKAGIEQNSSHRRGARLWGERQLAKVLRRQNSRFAVGKIPVPIDLETRGFLLAGAPGTGKSQTLTHALDSLRSDGATAIIADASGIYTSRFFEEGKDVTINPFDNRCAAWSPLAELESIADIPAMCKSLIPDADGEARVWSSYAQTALGAILEHCLEAGANNGEIFRLTAVADLEELRSIFAGTPAQPLAAEGNEKMFASVRGSMTDALPAIRHLDPAVGADGFSIRKHIATGAPGWIFLSYQQQHRDTLRSLIAACADVSARAVFGLPPSPTRRVIFALDELPLLGKIQSIVDLATNGRKHGAVIFAGLQTIAQINAIYGRDTAQTLLACLGSWLVLRVSDAETAEYMSKYLGDEEKTRIVKSGGKSSQVLQNGSTSSNWQEQVVKDRVVLPSELQALPDLRGIFNLAGPVPAAVVNLKIAAQRQITEAYIPAPARKRLPVQRQVMNGNTQGDAEVELPY